MTQDKPLSERMNQLGPDGINPQAKYFSREVSALEAESTRLKQQLDAERQKCEAMREALVEAAIPLEVIAGALNIGDMQEISVEVAQQIHKAVSLIRAALAEPAQPQTVNKPGVSRKCPYCIDDPEGSEGCGCPCHKPAEQLGALSEQKMSYTLEKKLELQQKCESQAVELARLRACIQKLKELQCRLKADHASPLAGSFKLGMGVAIEALDAILKECAL